MSFGTTKTVAPPAALSTSVSTLLANADHISIIDLIQVLIEEAYKLRASDIHIDPYESTIVVRLRIDGVLRDHCTFPRTIIQEVISRIKILSQLRTDEHQAAQDGRFRMTTEEAESIDIRVSITPTYYGENAVLRLLTDKSSAHTLTSLGFSQKDRERITQALTHPHGMILVTGPTGSGKTTTLYTFIKQLNKRDVSIITIEDPIEYAVSGITQIQINAHSNLTFANGLRSILRQDPDIIMVGEIRDSETATIATNTALTGHLLLSTLHTNDSTTTLPRLLEMGIDAYLVASTVRLVIGQRLVRKICEHCKETHHLSNLEKTSISQLFPQRLKEAFFCNTFYAGKGCTQCENTGFKGRIGVYEVLYITPIIHDAILRRDSPASIKNIAVSEGMTTMIEDGIQKAAAGLTTLSELMRTISE